MAADTLTLAQMRTYLEEITHTQNDATFPGSAYELQLIMKAYQKSAYKYNWPQTLVRFFDTITANVDRYTLQTNFRKFIFLFSQGAKLDPTDLEYIGPSAYSEYAVALDSLEYIIGCQPLSTTPIYNISGTISPGAAVTITLDTVDGISAGDEIYISGTNAEFTKVQSVSGLTIVAKVVSSHTSVPLYRTADGNYGQIQKIVPNLVLTTDVPIIPGETHLIIPHYAAALYYKDIQEDDRAASHMATWQSDLDEAWQAFGKTENGAVGQMII